MNLKEKGDQDDEWNSTDLKKDPVVEYFEHDNEASGFTIKKQIS